MKLFFAYGVGLSATLSSFGMAAGTPYAELSKIRSWESIGVWVHEVHDLNRDGRAELVITKPGGHDVVLLQSDDTSRGYHIRARFRSSGIVSWERPARVKVIDFNGDDEPEIYIAWTDGESVIIDGQTLQTIYSGTAPSLNDFDIGDVDGDGVAELVTGSSSTVSLFDPLTMQPKGQFFVEASLNSGIRVGDVNGDVRKEVISGDGFAIEVTEQDGQYSGEVVWTNSLGELGWFEPVDTNGDGKLEIASVGLFTDLNLHQIHPIPATSVLRPILPDSQISHAFFDDVNDDGRPDAVLTIDGLRIEGIDLASGLPHWSFDRAYPSGFAIGFGEIQGTDAKQLVFANSGRLDIENVGPQSAPIWRTVVPQAAPGAWALIGRSDQHRKLALLAGPASSAGPGVIETWSGGGLIDGNGSSSTWLPDLKWPMQYWQTGVVAAENHAHPAEAIIVAGAEVSTIDEAVIPRLWFLDANANLERTLTLDIAFVPMAALGVGAFDEPSAHVAILGNEYPSFAEGKLFLINTESGQVSWESEGFAGIGAGVAHLLAGDLDMDGHVELIARAAEQVFIFSPVNGTSPIKTYGNVRDVAVNPSQNSLASKLLLLRNNNAIELYGDLGDIPQASFTPQGFIHNIASFNQYPADEILVAAQADNSLHIYSFDKDLPLQSLDFVTPGLGLSVVDVDADRQLELVRSGVGEFEVYRYSNEFIHVGDFEGGDDPTISRMR